MAENYKITLNVVSTRRYPALTSVAGLLELVAKLPRVTLGGIEPYDEHDDDRSDPATAAFDAAFDDTTRRLHDLGG